jgi:heavy metal sensor kinase
MNKSLRLRLTLFYTAFFAGLFVLFAVLLYGVLSHSLNERLNETLASEADTAAGLLADEYHEMGGQAVAAAREVVSDMKLRNDLVAILTGNRVLASTVPVSPESLDGEKRRIAEREVTLDETVYRVLVAAPLEPIRAELAELRRTIGIGLPLALALAAAGAWLLATRALRPLHSLAEQTRHITETSLDSRITLAEAASELQVVVGSFNDLLGRLDRSFAMMRRFVADASHELRTPVSVIRGEADVALSRERSSAEYRESLAVILDESRRVSALIDDLLNLARADSGRVRLETHEFYLNELLAECCRKVNEAAKARNLTLDALPAADVQYRGDEHLLRRLILNLLDNAIRYTPPGGRITAGLEISPAGVRLRVADTGIGIPPEHVPRVFERFYRTDEARSREAGGFGLGLSIVKWIAEAHRGAVECASAPGAGSVFTVTLPR